MAYVGNLLLQLGVRTQPVDNWAHVLVVTLTAARSDYIARRAHENQTRLLVSSGRNYASVNRLPTHAPKLLMRAICHHAVFPNR